jgi:hypothetical protein
MTEAERKAMEAKLKADMMAGKPIAPALATMNAAVPAKPVDIPEINKNLEAARATDPNGVKVGPKLDIKPDSKVLAVPDLNKQAADAYDQKRLAAGMASNATPEVKGGNLQTEAMVNQDYDTWLEKEGFEDNSFNRGEYQRRLDGFVGMPGGEASGTALNELIKEKLDRNNQKEPSLMGNTINPGPTLDKMAEDSRKHMLIDLIDPRSGEYGNAFTKPNYKDPGDIPAGVGGMVTSAAMPRPAVQAQPPVGDDFWRQVGDIASKSGGDILGALQAPLAGWIAAKQGRALDYGKETSLGANADKEAAQKEIKGQQDWQVKLQKLQQDFQAGQNAAEMDYKRAVDEANKLEKKEDRDSAIKEAQKDRDAAYSRSLLNVQPSAASTAPKAKVDVIGIK